MGELKEKLIKSLKGYNFKELEEMLSSQKEPEVREAIMNAMEKYHEEEFINWIG